MSKLQMNCYFCNRNVYDVKHFSLDADCNVIVACDECYEKVKQFNGGSKRDVKSGLCNKRPE